MVLYYMQVGVGETVRCVVTVVVCDIISRSLRQGRACTEVLLVIISRADQSTYPMNTSYQATYPINTSYLALNGNTRYACDILRVLSIHNALDRYQFYNDTYS